MAAVLFFSTASSVFAYTETTINSNVTLGDYAGTIRGIRYQGVYPSASYEQNGKIYNTATVYLDQRMSFGGAYSLKYVNGLITYQNEIIVTCSDSSARIVNLQVNNTSEYDNIQSSAYVDSYDNTTPGAYTSTMNNRVIYTNYLMTGTNNNVLPMCKYMVVITWETTNDNTYCQIQITPNAGTPNIYMRTASPADDVTLQHQIIDALADSNDIQLMVDYLENIDGDVSSVLQYIVTYYPDFSQHLLSILGVQQSIKAKLYEIYVKLDQFYTAWVIERSKEASEASAVESRVEEEQSVVESVEADITYETIEPSNAVVDADNIIDTLDQSKGYMFLWTQRPIIIALMTVSVSFAIIGFIIYGKGKS